MEKDDKRERNRRKERKETIVDRKKIYMEKKSWLLSYRGFTSFLATKIFSGR